MEQAANPSLRGRPCALHQAGAIIAANPAAVAAGVRTNSTPAEARTLLRPLGGVVVSAHVAADGRVSHKPYRAAGAALLRLLRGLPGAEIVERAAIDEAFVSVSLPTPAPSWADAAEAGLAWAQAAREAASSLGLTLSAGVGPNKLLAVVAAHSAGPGAVAALRSAQHAESLLLAAPLQLFAAAQPSAAAASCAATGVVTAADDCTARRAELLLLGPEALAAALGAAPSCGARLWRHLRGICDGPVQDRGPPASVVVRAGPAALQPASPQPAALQQAAPKPSAPQHAAPQQSGLAERHGEQAPAAAAAAAVAAAAARSDGAAAGRARVERIVGAMASDLAERILEDTAEHARWPAVLLCSIQGEGSGVASSARGSFPQHPATGGPAAQAGEEVARQEALAVAAAAASRALLAEAAQQLRPRDAPIFRITLSATAFGPPPQQPQSPAPQQPPQLQQQQPQPPPGQSPQQQPARAQRQPVSPQLQQQQPQPPPPQCERQQRHHPQQEWEEQPAQQQQQQQQQQQPELAQAKRRRSIPSPSDESAAASDSDDPALDSRSAAEQRAWAEQHLNPLRPLSLTALLDAVAAGWLSAESVAESVQQRQRLLAARRRGRRSSGVGSIGGAAQMVVLSMGGGSTAPEDEYGQYV